MMCANKYEGFSDNKKGINDLYMMSIVQDFFENMDHNSTYILGEGEETNAILLRMGLEISDNGINIIKNGQIVSTIQNSLDLEKLTSDANTKLVVCPRDDGTIFHEFSKEINKIKKENITILVTPTRLEKIRGKPFTVKTDDTELNKHLSGFYPLTTSYRRKAIYKISNNEKQNKNNNNQSK